MPRPTSPSDLAPSLSIAPEPFDGDAARHVVAQAEAELVARYGVLGDGELSLAVDLFAPPRGFFLIGRIGADAHLVGGAGLRPQTETIGIGIGIGIGEVKRLWVDPSRRGQGIGRALMGRLEATAADLGYATLRLETGPKQPEAVALYGTSGWTRQDGPWDQSGCIPDGVIRFFKDVGVRSPGE